MTEEILKTVRAWILKNGNPRFDCSVSPQIHITNLVYDHKGEKIDVDLVWIRSKGKYDRVEFEYAGKLIKAEINWK